MMDTSDAFPIAYLNAGDSICINVEDISEDWNCKYNVNTQVSKRDFSIFFILI